MIVWPDPFASSRCRKARRGLLLRRDTVTGAVHALEDRIAALCGRRHCVLTGRGSSALYIAYRALGGAGRKVALPAILCPSPAYVALYAGAQPIFCDVSADDGTLSPAALDELLDRDNEVSVVVAAHIYGNPADMDAIGITVRRHGVPVVEDAAMSLGGSLCDRPLGSFGDVSILSFGYSKIIDVGHGGAALTDDDELADRLRAEAERLPAMPDELPRLARDYRSAYYGLKELAGDNPRLNARFASLADTFRELYLFRFDARRAGVIDRALDRLDDEVAARRRKAEIYREELAGSGISLLLPRRGAVPWRFNVMLPSVRQQEVTEALRAAGFDASNWYPALYRWFETGRAQSPTLFANAHAIESGILNLWLDAATDEAHIRACCATLAKGLEKAEREGLSELSFAGT